MADIEELRAHLADRYGFRAQAVFSFEDDVTLMRDAGGTAWIARTFGPGRPREAVEGDAAILAWLEERGYPAERVIGSAQECVSSLGVEETVMVTAAVRAVPRARRRETIKDAGGIRGLGSLLGRLHALELGGADDDTVPGAGAEVEVAVQRPGGAWHHMAQGRPSAELAVAADWLIEAQERAGVRELVHFGVLEDALEAMDDCEGLPEAVLHPDFVLANVVATSTPKAAMVLVDWAGAGTGPRLWSLAWLLCAEGGKDLRRVDLAVAGYRQHIQLATEELDRLAAVICVRPLIFDIWCLHHHSRAAADAAAAVEKRRVLAEAIAERARTAFAH